MSAGEYRRQETGNRSQPPLPLGRGSDAQFQGVAEGTLNRVAMRKHAILVW